MADGNVMMIRVLLQGPSRVFHDQRWWHDDQCYPWSEMVTWWSLRSVFSMVRGGDMMITQISVFHDQRRDDQCFPWSETWWSVFSMIRDSDVMISVFHDQRWLCDDQCFVARPCKNIPWSEMVIACCCVCLAAKTHCPFFMSCTSISSIAVVRSVYVILLCQ